MKKSKDVGYEYILSNQFLQLPIIRYYQKRGELSYDTRGKSESKD